MGLERIHLYHLVRVLRVVVPLLVVGLASAFAWQYLNRPVPEPEAEPETRLQDNMINLTEGVTYSQERDGCTIFTVAATRNLGFEGGVNQLEDVEVVLRGDCETSVEQRIRGARCGVVRSEGDAIEIRCEGSVEVDLDPRTTARTERLVYDHRSETVSTSDAPVEIVRPGEFEVRADRMTVRFREGLFRLEGSVRIVRADGSVIEAEEVGFDEARNRLTASGGFQAVSPRMELTGQGAEAWLEPETLRPSRLQVRGEVRLRSLDPREPGSMSARELDVDFEEGPGTAVRGRGRVDIESGAGDTERTLSAEEVSAVLGDGGAIESLDAVGEARMTLGSGGVLTSARIRQTREGSESLLESSGASIRGSGFSVDPRASIIDFATDSRASIASASGVFEGDTTRASFDPEAGTVIRLEQAGSVSFTFDERSGSAERLRVDAEWVRLEGNARVEGADFVLEGEAIGLGRTDDALEADGGVLLVAAGAMGDEGPIIVEGDRLRGGGDEALRFSGAVVLRQGGSQVRAGRLDVDPDGRRFVAGEGVISTTADITVRSDAMRFDAESGRVEYSGRAQARTDELTVDASMLEVTRVDGEIDQLDATGDVRVFSAGGMEGTGESAVYRRSGGTVTLFGPGAVAVDPASGRCTGDEIVVDIETRFVTVRSEGPGRAVCLPLAPASSPAPNGSGTQSR
jgi:lipopolysaccharide transport protein LptA